MKGVGWVKKRKKNCPPITDPAPLAENTQGPGSADQWG